MGAGWGRNNNAGEHVHLITSGVHTGREMRTHQQGRRDTYTRFRTASSFKATANPLGRTYAQCTTSTFGFKYTYRGARWDKHLHARPLAGWPG